MSKKIGIRRFLPPELLNTSKQNLTSPGLLAELAGMHRELIRLSRAVLLAGAGPLMKARRPRRAGRAAKSAAKPVALESAVAVSAVASAAAESSAEASAAEAELAEASVGEADAAEAELAEASAAEAEPAEASAASESAPVPGYEGLSRTRRAAFLKRCSDEELLALREQESGTGGRPAALQQIERELAARERTRARRRP